MTMVSLFTSKKGQVTLFIIVGVVILIVFLFLFSLTNALSEQKLNEQLARVVESALDTATVQSLVSVCVEDALKTGLIIIGRQGGQFSEGQFGSLINPDLSAEKLMFDNWNVSFAVIMRDESLPPVYPCFGIDGQQQSYCNYPWHTGLVQFGVDKLPKLEGGPFSIEGQLERYVSAYVENCVDADQLVEVQGLASYDVKVEGVPVTTVNFRNTDVVASVDYQLLVSIGGVEPITQFVSFESQLPVRFRFLYGAVKDIMRREVSNVSFDISNDIFHDPIPFSRLTPSILFDHKAAGESDIFIFNDSFSLIDGQNYVFQVARKNRPPALEYINKSQSLRDYYDYLIIQGESVTLRPRAEDPDEGTVQFEYSGDFGLGAGPEFNTNVLSPGYYNQTVNATDGYLGDWQNVRVLVDNKLNVDYTVRSIYSDAHIPPGYISREDPVILDASATNTTLDPFAKYSFRWLSSLFIGSIFEPDFACSLFPSGRCEGALPEIETITQQNNLPSFGKIGVDLEVTLDYNGIEQWSRKFKEVNVVPCLPHRNPGSVPAGIGTDIRSVEEKYLANHACCISNTGDLSDPISWQIAGEGTECYNEQRCFQGYYLADFKRFCGGQRGNTCSNSASDTLVRISPTQCGRKTITDCHSNIATACEGQSPYTINGNGAWCYGTFGCERACTTEVVLSGSTDVRDSGNSCGCRARDVASGRACIDIATGNSGTCQLTLSFDPIQCK